MQGGGSQRIEMQHKLGKKTARERVALLLDDNSFVEMDIFMKQRTVVEGTDAPGEGVVSGFGTIDGRPLYVYAQDFTVLDGAFGEMHAKKITKAIDMAVKTGVPIVSIIDSAGARLTEGLDALDGYGRVFQKKSSATGVIPQICVVAGPCAGATAFIPTLSDFVFMANENASIFSTGPSVLSAISGKEVLASQLGGNMDSGQVHFAFSEEEECFNKVKELIAYLPSNNLEVTFDEEPTDDLNRNTPELDEYSGDVKAAIIAIVDNGKFLETMIGFGTSLVTGFARINGRVVGVVANNASKYNGDICIDAADKGAGFIMLCDSFNIPILTLVDTVGIASCADLEKSGLMRHAAKLMYAFSTASVPKVSVVLGNAIGGGYIAMASRALGTDMVYAWPSAIISPVEPEAAAIMLYGAQIQSAVDPVAARKEFATYYKENEASALSAAGKGYIDDIFEPSSTRPMVAAAFELLSSKREDKLPKKHGVMPV